MNVLHINTGQTGGASFCAMRISNALKSQGVETKLLVQAGEPHDDVFVAEKDRSIWNSNWLLVKMKHLLTRLGLLVDEDVLWYEREKALPGANNIVYTNVPLTSYKNIAHHPLVEWADVIHLHWVACFVDYPSFFREVKKPIVWTLHDQFPCIGLMHFVSEKSPLPTELNNLDNLCLEIKKKAVAKADIHPVAISEMMENEIKKSDVLGRFPIVKIHNGVDTEIFKPHDKKETRLKYGIAEDATVFLFSSFSLWVERKGLDRVLEALSDVDMPNKVLVCVGSSDGKALPKMNFPVIVTEMLESQEELARLYSAADFYLQASYHEAFSQTNLEAMSCGTPVISTPCSGASDLIRDFNGIVCEGFEVADIVKGINEAVKRSYDTERIRQYILDNYDYPIIAQQYKKLYERIVNDHE